MLRAIHIDKELEKKCSAQQNVADKTYHLTKL